MKPWCWLLVFGAIFVMGCGQEDKGNNKGRDIPVPAQNPPAPKGDK